MVVSHWSMREDEESWEKTCISVSHGLYGGIKKVDDIQKVTFAQILAFLGALWATKDPGVGG